MEPWQITLAHFTDRKTQGSHSSLVWDSLILGSALKSSLRSDDDENVRFLSTNGVSCFNLCCRRGSD
jgi:hypothetical protein